MPSRILEFYKLSFGVAPGDEETDEENVFLIMPHCQLAIWYFKFRSLDTGIGLKRTPRGGVEVIRGCASTGRAKRSSSLSYTSIHRTSLSIPKINLFAFSPFLFSIATCFHHNQKKTGSHHATRYLSAKINQIIIPSPLLVCWFTVSSDAGSVCARAVRTDKAVMSCPGMGMGIIIACS